MAPHNVIMFESDALSPQASPPGHYPQISQDLLEELCASKVGSEKTCKSNGVMVGIQKNTSIIWMHGKEIACQTCDFCGGLTFR